MMYKLRTLQDNMAATTETLTKTQERIGTIHILRKHCLGGEGGGGPTFTITEI